MVKTIGDISGEFSSTDGGGHSWMGWKSGIGADAKIPARGGMKVHASESGDDNGEAGSTRPSKGLAANSPPTSTTASSISCSGVLTDASNRCADSGLATREGGNPPLSSVVPTVAGLKELGVDEFVIDEPFDFRGGIGTQNLEASSKH